MRPIGPVGSPTCGGASTQWRPLGPRHWRCASRLLLPVSRRHGGGRLCGASELPAQRRLWWQQRRVSGHPIELLPEPDPQRPAMLSGAARSLRRTQRQWRKPSWVDPRPWPRVRRVGGATDSHCDSHVVGASATCNGGDGTCPRGVCRGDVPPVEVCRPKAQTVCVPMRVAAEGKGVTCRRVVSAARELGCQCVHNQPGAPEGGETR